MLRIQILLIIQNVLFSPILAFEIFLVNPDQNSLLFNVTSGVRLSGIMMNNKSLSFGWTGLTSTQNTVEQTYISLSSPTGQVLSGPLLLNSSSLGQGTPRMVNLNNNNLM